MTLNRNNKIIAGLSEIEKYLDSHSSRKNLKLTWKVDFVDVSDSGDMSYTYGNYNYSFDDESGKKQNFKGLFHTIWKMQSNRRWRYVYD